MSFSGAHWNPWLVEKSFRIGQGLYRRDYYRKKRSKRRDDALPARQVRQEVVKKINDDSGTELPGRT